MQVCYHRDWLHGPCQSQRRAVPAVDMLRHGASSSRSLRPVGVLAITGSHRPSPALGRKYWLREDAASTAPSSAKGLSTAIVSLAAAVQNVCSRLVPQAASADVPLAYVGDTAGAALGVVARSSCGSGR